MTILNRTKQPTYSLDALPEVTIQLPEKAPGWLQETFEQHAKSDYAYTRAKAVGIVYMHAAAACLEDARGIGIEKLLTMEPPDKALRRQALTWIQTLDSKTIESLEYWCETEAFGIETDISLNLNLQHVCIQRDNLEGMCRLLEAVGHGVKLRNALGDLDAYIQEALLKIVDNTKTSEQLQSTCWEDPTAWWGYLGS